MSDPAEIKFLALSNFHSIGNSVWIGTDHDTPALDLSDGLLPDYVLVRGWKKLKTAMTTLVKKTFIYSFFVVFTAPLE